MCIVAVEKGLGVGGAGDLSPVPLVLLLALVRALWGCGALLDRWTCLSFPRPSPVIAVLIKFKEPTISTNPEQRISSNKKQKKYPTTHSYEILSQSCSFLLQPTLSNFRWLTIWWRTQRFTQTQSCNNTGQKVNKRCSDFHYSTTPCWKLWWQS